MFRTTVATLLVALLCTACAATPAAEVASPAPQPLTPVVDPLSPAGVAAADEFLWLEEVQGERALTWVREQNARTKAVLEGDTRYAAFRADALQILTSDNRIPTPRWRAGGIDNFWQDRTHVRGVWRRTTPASYRAARPRWETVLDIDALARAENRNWIYKSATCLPPARRYCIVSLSDGGKDAVTLREYDTATRTFRADGFVIREGKHRFDWVDADTIAIATDFGPETLTASGYPFVVKVLKRGETLAQAREVYRGDAGDGGYGVNPTTLRDAQGAAIDLLVTRPLSTFEGEAHLVLHGSPRRIDLPTKSAYQTFVDGQLVFSLQTAWREFPQGVLVSYDLASLSNTAAAAKLVLAPASNEALGAVESTKNKLVVSMLADVKGAVDVLDYVNGSWSRHRLGLPRDVTTAIVSASSCDDRVFLSTQGFLEPPTLWLADATRRTVTRVKAQSPQFDASGAMVQQEWAVSRDGTRIPFFIVRPKTLPTGGAPTLLFGYGGFEVSKPPAYIPEMGKLWLERGNVFVNANIRGGGEFGPAWHQSVLRENRQKAFDDFAAVAQRLVELGVTTPAQLGIYGRSNGGVLTSVTLTQHPELIGGAVIESPLIDMMRYQALPPGASWIGEYGDPRIPAEAAFIAKYSAYQHIATGTPYPEVYITTNTRDDRVHPGHARKFAARLQAKGHPALYYENTEGGHSNDSDPVVNAERWARHYVYLSRQLKAR